MGNIKAKLYQCKICHLKYNEKKWAKKCQSWCKKHKSCNIEILKHVIED